MDDGILVVESCNRVHCHWQYTTSARSSCRREVRNGPTWSIGWSRQAQEPTIFVLLTIAKNKHCVIHFVLVALGAVARVNEVIRYILPEYINHVSLAWMSAGYPQQHVPLLDSVVGGGMVDESKDNLICPKKLQTIKQMGLVKNESVLKFRIPQCQMRNQNISTDNWPRFLIIEPISEGALNSLSPFTIHKALQVWRVWKEYKMVVCLSNVLNNTFWNLKLCAIYQLR